MGSTPLLPDEDVVTPESLLHRRLEQGRRQVPRVIGDMAQIVVDNPGQFVLVGSGVVVFTKVMANAMRPRTPLQALALFVVCHAGSMVLLRKAMEAGLLRFRVRDEDGNLVPLEI